MKNKMEKYIKNIGNFLIKHRYIIALVILIICVIFELNGSSIGFWNYCFSDNNTNDGVIFGQSRQIRSDEYMVNTAITLSQYHNNFAYTNNILRGTDTDVFIYCQPVKDISMIFRIFQIGYLFLSPGKGISLFWTSRILALILATFEFSMLITNKNKKLSVISTALISSAPTIQWWFATNTLIEMIVYAEVAIVLIDKYMNTESFAKRLIYSTIIFICAGSFVLCVYPAWLISIVYIFLPFLIWVITKNIKTFKFSAKSLVCDVIIFAIVAGLIVRIGIKSWDMIVAMLNTSYPGKRISQGGGALMRNAIYQFGIMLPFKNNITNPCEGATIIDFWPVAIILLVLLLVKDKKKDPLLIMCVIAYIFLNIYSIFGFPKILSKITLLSYATADRVSMVIGILTVFMLVRCICLMKSNYINKKEALAISLIISIFLSIVTFIIRNYTYMNIFCRLNLQNSNSTIITYLIKKIGYRKRHFNNVSSICNFLLSIATNKKQ